MTADLARFYELLSKLEARPGQGMALAEYSARSNLPGRGVYFFFEPGEYRRQDPDRPRVVRVGTHAVSAGSKATLWSRIRTHRGARHGGGNHRASIFRRHVGAAMLARDGEFIGDHPSWGVRSSASKAVRDSEATHERRVSEYLGRMSVLWVEVADEPGPDSERAYIERNAIALLSNELDPLDPPSEAWLGRHSTREAIARSGLWNLNHVAERYDREFLDLLHARVADTGRGF
jgi:hypothetical protein